MAAFDIELVGKIGSMALIDTEYSDMNYNVIARISRELRPGYVWVTSGATEIGKLDYIKRNGKPLEGDEEENKTDYAAQGQSVLMQTYRQFVDSRYSVRQILVEHQHFNDAEKREHLCDMLRRCPKQNAIPIINYNDAISCEENRKLEINRIKESGGHAIEWGPGESSQPIKVATQPECEYENGRAIFKAFVFTLYNIHASFVECF